MTIEDAKNACTVSTIWVCMIDGRFLVSQKGKAGFKRKADAALAFKHSEYWLELVEKLKKDNKELCNISKWGLTQENTVMWWNDNRGKELEDALYEKLLTDKVVKYYEIEPVPDWVG